MYRIRFHGRGGQGIKTAGHILGTSFFLAGFHVQDAPRYGAERRGAPIFAYVRADTQAIHERGIIVRPDLVVVADDSLVAMPESGVLTGADAATIFFILSNVPADVWQERLNITGPVFTLPPPEKNEIKFIGAAVAGGAVGLLGLIDKKILETSIARELTSFGNDTIDKNLTVAGRYYDALQDYHGRVQEGGPVSVDMTKAPNWIDLPLDDAQIAAPAIHSAASSEHVKTGLWRTQKPVIDYRYCNHCWWICSTFCPEGAINVDNERKPCIDYDHCKGCMICLAQCPAHAIEAHPEQENNESEVKGS